VRSMDELRGRQLGEYRILDRLGEGGMSAVYRAHQPGVNREVALKVLPRHFVEDEAAVGRFRQEAQVLARLQHPHILPIFDFGESDDLLYIAMPLVRSGTLADRLRRGPLDLEEAARIVSQLADALDYAHEQGLVHRDIKPGNVLLDGRGNAMLTDFGIARFYEATTRFTQTGGVVGTPAYMSPEQSRGEGIDRRSDVYCLGIVLYEMVTGRVPFEADTPVAVLLKHLQEAPPRPREINRDLPPGVERVILTALAKRPEARYQTAGALARDLQAAIPPSPARGTRMRLFVAAGAVLAILCLAAAGALWVIFGPGGAAAGEEESLAAGDDLPPTAPAVSGTATGEAAATATGTPDAAAPEEGAPSRPAPAETTVLAEGGAEATPTATPTAAATATATATETPAPADWRHGKLAFLVFNNGLRALYTMDLAAGGDPQLAYRPPGTSLLGTLWSPDGREIVAYELDGTVTFVDPEEGSARTAGHRCTAPDWSPDGERLICRSLNGDTFAIIDGETGALRGTVPRPATALLPQWSPVADEIVYATLDGDATAIWRRSLEGGLPVELAADSLENYAPAWSPDGQWIAYQSRLGSANSEIWVMDRDGENARRLTESPGGSWSRAPYWSPDGRWLAFVSNREGGAEAEYGDVFVVSVETGVVAQVTRTGGRVYNWRVSWSW